MKLTRYLALAACALATVSSSVSAQPGGGDPLTPTTEPTTTSTTSSTTSDGKVSKSETLEFVFGANGRLSKTTVETWTQPEPDMLCNQDTVFIIDNSGSMSRHRVSMFSALNVAIATLRSKGHSRVSTVVFSDSPAVFGPSKDPKRPNAVKTTGCHFCWQTSDAKAKGKTAPVPGWTGTHDLRSQPFPNPNKWVSGSLTDLAKGVEVGINIIEKDVAGKGPAGDGKRLDPTKPYNVVLVSDLLQTKGMSSPNSQAFRNLEDMVLRTFCAEDWKKYVVKTATGYELRPKYASQAKTVCKGAIAKLHYLFFSGGYKGNSFNKAVIEKMKTDNPNKLRALSDAWKAMSQSQWARSTKGSAGINKAMYDLFSGSANTMGGAVYHAHTTTMVTYSDAPSLWSQMEFIQTLLGDCTPLKHTSTIITVDIDPLELPQLHLNVDPLVRHFPNARTQVDPTYTNTLGKDDVGFFSEPLARFRDQVVAYKEQVTAYVTDLQKQLKDYEAAAATDAVLKGKLPTVKSKVDAAINKARAAEKAELGKVMSMLKFDKLFVGGFASTRGSDATVNLRLSTQRARAALCLLEGAFEKLEIANYATVVGYYGHQAHCKATLQLIGTPEKSCTNVQAVQSAANAWAAAPADAEEKAARQLELTQLEDDARRAEVHFQEASAVEAGFKARCCVTKGTATCPSTLQTCAADFWSADQCADKASWQVNWGVAHQEEFESELAAVGALMMELKVLTQPLDGVQVATQF